MASLMPQGKQRYTDNNGNNLSGGKLFAFAAGTSTPLDTYSDQAGATPNAHPVILNSRGEATVFWGSSPYKVVLKDASDVEIWSQDNLHAQVNLADLSSTASGKGAALVGFIQAGTGATARTALDKMREVRTVRDYGADGLTTSNATSAIQAAVAAAIADSIPGNSLCFPDGDYRTSEITIPIDDVSTSSAGRISIYGNGDGSAITMRDSPNQNIFTCTGTGSFGFSMHDLRFQVATQGNNVDANVLDTGTTATMLDFQVFNNYLNGVPRGFAGQYVSGIFLNNLFDFMTDYGIWSRSKEFRKLELVGNHFYKVKQRSIYVQGDLNSSGGATTQADRDNGRGAGHLVIAGNGFDQIFDNTETCQMIYMTGVDNFVISSNWFNGKTPDSTDYPLDAIRLVDCHNFVIDANAAWLLDRGVYLDSCTNFVVANVQITDANKDAGTTVGALTLLNCTDFDARVSVTRSGGVGIHASGCTDFRLSGVVHDAQFSGAIIDACTRGEVQIRVVDANMANAGHIGIDVTGASSGVILDGSSSYVTNVSAGQVTNIRLGASTSNCRMAGGNVTAVRTAGTAISDSGSSNTFRGIRGFTTKAAGQVTITNPATTSVVTHGLSLTPSIADINLTFNDASSGVTRVWPSSVTSTQFTINTNATPTTSAAIGWFVDTER